MVWFKSGARGNFCLVPALNGKAFGLSPLIIILTVFLTYIPLISLKKVPFISSLLMLLTTNDC